MEAHWRDSMRPVRFLMLDARSSFGIALVLVHAAIYTLLLCVLIMFVFWMFEQRGLSTGAAVRAFRAWLAGQRRPAIILRAHRYFADYDEIGPL